MNAKYSEITERLITSRIMKEYDEKMMENLCLFAVIEIHTGVSRLSSREFRDLKQFTFKRSEHLKCKN